MLENIQTKQTAHVSNVQDFDNHRRFLSAWRCILLAFPSSCDLARDAGAQWDLPMKSSIVHFIFTFYLYIHSSHYLPSHHHLLPSLDNIQA